MTPETIAKIILGTATFGSVFLFAYIWRVVRGHGAEKPFWHSVITILLVIAVVFGINAIPVSVFRAEAAAPTFDAFSTGAASGPSDVSFSHTASVDTTAIVITCGYTDTDKAIRVSYGGTLVNTATTSVSGSPAQKIEMWYLTNPPTGANTVLVKQHATASGHRQCAALTVEGTDTTDAKDSDGTNSFSSATSQQVSITTTVDDVLLIDVIHIKNTSATLTQDGSQTQTFTFQASNHTTEGSRKVATTAGAHTMDWTTSASESGYIAVIGLKPPTTAVSSSIPAFILSDPSF